MYATEGHKEKNGAEKWWIRPYPITAVEVAGDS